MLDPYGDRETLTKQQHVDADSRTPFSPDALQWDDFPICMF